MKKEYHTKVREELMEYVSDRKEGSFDAQEAYEALQEKGIEANLTTVYRNLEKLVQKNTLVKFKSKSSSSMMYRVVDQHSNCHRHLHLRCKYCGKIYHMEGGIMDLIDKYAKDTFNFNLDCQDSILMGVCYECSKEN